MSRSGYTDDCENLWLWRGAVANAINGRRGQVFLRELLASLDALPTPRLVANELEENGQVCSLGAVGVRRGVDMTAIDPEDHEHHQQLSKLFGIAPALVQEIEYMNDEGNYRNETPEERFTRMRAWVVEQIRAENGEAPTNF